jgi:transcriptional regulator with XRE-family HTH domain
MKQIEKELKEDRELARLTRQEELILNVTELVLEKMEQRDLNKAQLAKLLGTNKSYITQLLRGSRNMTLRTISDIFFELDHKVSIDAIPLEGCDFEFTQTESRFVKHDLIGDWKLFPTQEVLISEAMAA